MMAADMQKLLIIIIKPHLADTYKVNCNVFVLYELANVNIRSTHFRKQQPRIFSPLKCLKT